MTKLIIDAATGDVREEALTPAEVLEREANELEVAKRIQDRETAKTAKADLLARLGITADEAKLLLG